MNKIYKKKNNIKYNKKIRNIRSIIEKRYTILIVIIAIIMFILITNLFYIQLLKKSYYVSKIEKLTQNVVYGSSAPRGRIYDRNGKLLVDNTPVKVIYYKRQSGVNTKDEISMAYSLANMIDVPHSNLHITNLKEFWLKNNPNLGKEKITDEEWNLLDERKLSLDDIERLKLERITEEELSIYDEIDKEAAYIYYLMNKGYSFSEKVIKKENVTDEEYAKVAENLDILIGFNTRLDWEREYLYGNTFRTILGNVSTSESGIPYELKDYYLDLGYNLDDRVGISYLEYQYENILKGTKNKYELLKSGENILIEEGKRGNDIVLTIDIELQKAIESILEEQLVITKNEANTEYYNRSFVIISNPNTGEILAMAGKQIVEKSDGTYQIYDYTPGITTSPVVVGSVVKGASHIVGYNNGGLKIGEVRDDSCIKIAATPLKCSWTTLGHLNDITALKQSSNVYQFKTAINIGKGVYKYNQPLSIDENAFTIYRNTFAEFGLGVETGIDLPVESLGYKGSSTLAGHLLDFSIGQYDTYTPIQLSQYVGTLATNGNRIKPYLLKSVYAPTKDGLTSLIYETKPVILNKVNTKDEYLERVKEGFKEVLKYDGTGAGYVNLKYKPAGKTGTSQSFIDTDLDGVVDTETLSNTFVAYAPYDDPKVTFTVVSPDVSHYGNSTNFRTSVNKRISYLVSSKYFELYHE